MGRKKKITVTSVDEYIKAIKYNCSESKTYVESIDGEKIEFSREISLSEVWFRGEPEIYKNIKSFVFRELDSQTDPIENELINNALQRFPGLFKNCNSTLEKLVTMQHYTLPTRLVDVTKNPLVALYFACQNSKKNGRVRFTNEIKISYSFLEKFAELIGWVDGNRTYSIDEIFNALSSQFPKGLNHKMKDAIFTIITDSFLFLPQYANDRIRNQQGAFVFSALFEADRKLLYEENRNKSLDNIENINDIEFHKANNNVDNVFSDQYFFIPKDSKSSLLKELDNYGINEAFVYPEPEHQMKYVNWYCIHHKY